jgi:hypothetical protein
MAYKDFVPSEEFKKFRDANGEDTYIKLNLLYIAFELYELYDGENVGSEFDDLCEDILELSLSEEFEDFDIIEISEAVVYIIRDSNYTVKEYENTYKRNREKVVEELLAVLNPDD